MFIINDPCVKSKISTRLYPLLLPQKCQLPAAAYRTISVNRIPALQRDTNFIKQALQFSCYAKSYAEAAAASDTLRDALQNFSGDMNGIRVGAVLINSEIITYEANTDNYSAHIEFEFQYIEHEGGE